MKELKTEIKQGIDEGNQKHVDWDKLEKMYGKSTSQVISNPLQLHQKLIGTQKKLIKPKEPMALIQKNKGITEFKEGVTQGVLEYEGSDGKSKRVWISKKFLSTMSWGNDTVRYYNITEDSAIPNGLTDSEIRYDELAEVVDANALNEEKLRAKEFKARGEMFMDIAKGIGVILLAIGAVIVAGKLFGVDILSYIFGGNGTEEVVKEIGKNVTHTNANLP